MLLLSLNMKLWPARAVQAPCRGKLTLCVIEPRVGVMFFCLKPAARTKPEFLHQGKLRSTAVVYRQVTGE